MGPFELLDLIGMDINLKVTRNRLTKTFGKPVRFTPSPVQEKLVADGHLGRKTGRGFYDHSGSANPRWPMTPKLKDASGWQPSDALKAFAEVLDKPADRKTWLYARIFMWR